jgi:hypothetical protein
MDNEEHVKSATQIRGPRPANDIMPARPRTQHMYLSGRTGGRPSEAQAEGGEAVSGKREKCKKKKSPPVRRWKALFQKLWKLLKLIARVLA